jgi:hypothetical protein
MPPGRKVRSAELRPVGAWSQRKLPRAHFLLSGVNTASAAIVLFDLIGRSGPGMRTDNENPSATGNGSGGEVGAGIFFDDATNVLTINVGWGSGKGFTDLTGPVTLAHIHNAGSADLTKNGGVIVNLDGATPGFNSSATNGGWTNTQVTLSATQRTQLFDGFLYLNVHTSANGGGEIRGNMIVAPTAVPEPTSLALVGLVGAAFYIRRRLPAAQSHRDS